jgi:hypothetical protein
MNKQFSIGALMLLTLFVAIVCVIWPFVSHCFQTTVPGDKAQYFIVDDVQYFPANANSQSENEATGRNAPNSENP